MKFYTPEILEKVETILNIGIALSAEKNHNHLLEKILTEARTITKADAGTLYLLEDDALVFKIIQNKTLNIFKGGEGEMVDLPPVKMDRANVSAYVALTKERINIPNVYEAKGFDFSGTRKYDKMTGYKCTSMLVLPLEDHEERVIGVLQLINAKDEEGNVVPFAPYYEKVVSSLASQAAISLTNAQILEDIENLFESFIQVMATAIDARTPYNANHTRRVALLAMAMATAIHEEKEVPFVEEFFDEDRTKQLVMAAWLHDIGKIAIPLSVMDKSTRLEERLPLVMLRLDYILALGGNEEEIKRARELIERANDSSNFINDEMMVQLKEVASKTYRDRKGEYNYLTEEELEALLVAKGNLTGKERSIMESHVEVTRRILEKIPFTSKLREVPKWAILHHEMLDGEGYPYRLKKEEIPLEGRILALVDVYDALTAEDRPYKKPMPVEKALIILSYMVKEEKIDAPLYHLFVKEKVWESIKRDEREQDAYGLKLKEALR